MSKLRTERDIPAVDDSAPVHVHPAVSRRGFAGAAALAGAGFFTAAAQTRSEQIAGRQGSSGTDPGPENKPLLSINPSANNPPFTDHGNPGPIWFSFDLAPKRIQGGGWTHQVTQRELPPSKDINRRLVPRVALAYRQ
jgi:oxalate decarboxylase